MVDELFDFLQQFNKGVKQGDKYNQYKSRPTYYKISVKDSETFNSIYQKLYNSNLNTIKRTKSGAIAKGPKAMCNNYAWDIKDTNASTRLTVTLKGYIFVFNVGAKKKEDIKTSPINAWNLFDIKCFEKGIDIHSYMIENGLEIKKTIPRAMISMRYLDETFENVHHIDFHSSYPSGLANTHPEFRPIIEEFYNKRKEDEMYKEVLNKVIGCMQSTKYKWSCRWAHLSKDAIEDNNRRLSHIAFQLEITGRKILGFNTDGVWYQGDIYHGDGEGDGLGQWRNDHTNCKFRAKSDGAYEFIENGVYHPVIRGESKLESIKPKEEWQWGDIYNGSILLFRFVEGVGIVHYED